MDREGATRPLLNTYRLQLHRGFTLDDARAVVPYLADLGVSHLYLSPISMATPGSTHGYDVIDPTRINPELGGEEAYARLVDELRAAGLGLVLDIVPNHMGIEPGAGNEYWRDVLKHGQESSYASLFDVDWQATEGGRVMLPILGAPLDEVIRDGAIEVDAAHEELRVYDHRLPLAPGSLAARNPDGDLHGLLARQHYQLEYWKTGQRTLNYRRFFAIDTLIGVRVEDPDAFELTHRLPLSLLDGPLDGLRIDHIDGLRDPAGYLERLRGRLADARAPHTGVLVEKILEADEPLPEWACDGTTGYDAMNEFTRVLIRGEHQGRFDDLDRRVTGRTASYAEEAASGRAHVVHDLLSEQFRRLLDRLFEAVQPAEVTADAFATAALALLAEVGPYRTYHRPSALDPRAARVFEEAARRIDPAPSGLETARRALSAPPEGAARSAVLAIQQIMPAVQAKGIEDRTLFRFRRLHALNEVGGDPDAFGERVEVFHRRMEASARRWPHRMLATATHDHKLGEDVRARLAALSEIPDEWEHFVDRALAVLERLAATRPGPRVHPADRYLMLQVLVGATPAGMIQGRQDDDQLADRVSGYLVKALREAAERTDWIDGDAEYEKAVVALTRAALEDREVGAMLDDFLAVLAPAGAANSLAQLVLKLGAPGVVDTYQGNEFWDLSLVDPDNRRPVDYGRRRTALASDASPEELVSDWRSGRLKARVLSRGLRARREHPRLFLDGAYEPVEVEGERAEHVIAYLRRIEQSTALIVAPRFPAGLLGGRGWWRPEWGDTRLRLPAGLEGSRAREVLRGGDFAPTPSSLSDLLGTFPAAMLLIDR